jgi:hypothetical protein
MVPEFSLPCSQKSASEPNLQTDEFSPHIHSFFLHFWHPRVLCFFCLIVLRTFLGPMHGSCSAHLILSYLISPLTELSGEEHNISEALGSIIPNVVGE